ncbi:M23 family metallopeptidase [Mesorhizobium sp. M7D.F.Ca.US.005.01.1.1]|jgi:hypothetical protein|uniref:M23 family metallopeptidase n=1 Tax=Mesorhizobium sp. M7D.F.Ca.US.005.01.1.1 TaxID=2493678 RepID=UPI000F751059|nr:M23 family metallopeptidase [Mesorhizobium sp. M7D.F.Ca.US.005.01.1.1]AZO41602.1 M23 family metallopeptidase [Mesorhizobium sp. M7D.F.Ca.US.005.01.1.1]
MNISQAMSGLMVVVCVIVPLALAWKLWRLDEPSFPGWLLVALDTVAFFLLVILVGRWDIAGLWTRLVLVGLVLVAASVSLVRHARRPWRVPKGSQFWVRHMTTGVSLTLFSAALAYSLTGFAKPEHSRSLAFPLERGHFVIAQGGSIGLLNHHAGHRAQRYALDITATNDAGFRSKSILPSDPASYSIFGASVISPCEGTVISVKDGLPDLPPPKTDRANAAGNHVVLSCNGMQVELAHFRQGSIQVRSRTPVSVGQRLGQVGNSGNSTEPHLHIHAVDPATGAGIPVLFDGRNPTRNTAFRR